MDKFILLHILARQLVTRLYLINATPIRKDEDEYTQRKKKNAQMIFVIEESLAEFDKHELVNKDSIGQVLENIQKIKDIILADGKTS